MLLNPELKRLQSQDMRDIAGKITKAKDMGTLPAVQSTGPKSLAIVMLEFLMQALFNQQVFPSKEVHCDGLKEASLPLPEAACIIMKFIIPGFDVAKRLAPYLGTRHTKLLELLRALACADYSTSWMPGGSPHQYISRMRSHVCLRSLSAAPAAVPRVPCKREST